jgi:hypothetical protein
MAVAAIVRMAREAPPVFDKDSEFVMTGALNCVYAHLVNPGKPKLTNLLVFFELVFFERRG